MRLGDDESHLSRIGLEHVYNGYEGTMIRMDQFDYKPRKQSNTQMTLKVFDGDDFEILGFLRGSRNCSETAKKANVKLNDRMEGIATMTGNQEYLRSIRENRTLLMGKMATAKYFGFTAFNQLWNPTLQTIPHNERL